MQILHIIPQFPYFEGGAVIGGHASPLLTLAREQAARGHEVTILSYIQERTGGLRIAPGLTAISLFPKGKPGSVGFGLRFLIAATLWARKNRKRFDVAHVHSGFAEYVLVARTIKAVTDIPTIHSLYCPLPIRGARQNQLVVRTLIKASVSALDGITTISSNIARSLSAFGIAEAAAVIPPAIDLSVYYPSRDMRLSRSSFHFKDDEVILLFVGNAKPQKNLTSVLKAFRALREDHPGTRLVVTTELPAASSDRNLSALTSEMHSLGIENAVTQFRIINNMPDLIRACDILVAPFLDSFGPSDYFMAVLEAMASGKPTIVSAVGGMPEIVTSDVGRLIDPLRVDDLAAAMRTLVSCEATRSDMGRRARMQMERRFSAADIASRFDHFYAKAVGAE